LTIYYTNDGGVSWNSSEQIAIKGAAAKLFFLDNTYGWLMITQNPGLGYSDVVLLKTVNGGQNWSVVLDETKDNLKNFLPHHGNKTGISFSDQERGWLVGLNTKEQRPWIYVTEDEGVTWNEEKVELPHSIVYDVIQVETPLFFNENKGILIVHTYLKDKLTTNFYLNEGSGEWSLSSKIENTKSDYVLSDFVSGNVGWISDGQALYATVDGLQTWKKLTDVNEIFNEENGEHKITSIDFVSEDKGWLIIQGKDNRHLLYQTNDGGNSWSTTSPKLVNH
jgi:photosystem II stability/assembly factor-like uncharacterized protein